MSVRIRPGFVLSLVLMASAAGGPASAAGVNSWEELTAQWLDAAFHQPGGRWAATVLATPPGWMVPRAGEATIVGVAQGVPKPKKIMVLAVVRKNGARGELRVQTACLVRVPVAGRVLLRGQALAPADWAWEERDLSTLPPDALRGEKELAGQRAKKALSPHEVICAHALEPCPDVGKAALILLRVRGEGVRISADAETLEEGYIGRAIKVKILGNGKIVTACLAGRETAELALTEGR